MVEPHGGIAVIPLQFSVIPYRAYPAVVAHKLRRPEAGPLLEKFRRTPATHSSADNRSFLRRRVKTPYNAICENSSKGPITYKHRHCPHTKCPVGRHPVTILDSSFPPLRLMSVPAFGAPSTPDTGAHHLCQSKGPRLPFRPGSGTRTGIRPPLLHSRPMPSRKTSENPWTPAASPI